MYLIKFVKDNSEKQVWYVFTGMGAQWHGMGKSMMEVSTFRKSIMKSNMVLQEFDIDLEAIIEKGTCTDGIVDIPVMITAIQVNTSGGVRHRLI
jgi:fatty acid synthase